MATRTYWTRTPNQLGGDIKAYTERVIVAVFALAQYFAQQMQNEMRNTAPWTDRTGNARSGLFGVAERMGKDVVVIYLSHGHTVQYGKWLELARGGRYATIMPTMQRNLPEIERRLKELLA